MQDTQYSKEVIVRLGKERYERDIRAHVEPQHKGKLLALDIQSGDYEIDVQAGPAVDRLKNRRPDATVFVLRVGHPTAYKFGARLKGLWS
jgi:hypothetical protein